jgi:hypothetical protein
LWGRRPHRDAATHEHPRTRGHAHRDVATWRADADPGSGDPDPGGPDGDADPQL